MCNNGMDLAALNLPDMHVRTYSAMRRTDLQHDTKRIHIALRGAHCASQLLRYSRPVLGGGDGEKDMDNNVDQFPCGVGIVAGDSTCASASLLSHSGCEGYGRKRTAA